MAKNCPSLEVLDLSHSKNVDDGAIKVIAENLKRLQELYIAGCHKLTDLSLEAIVEFCKFIKVLDISYCSGLSPDPRLRLTKINSLKTIVDEN